MRRRLGHGFGRVMSVDLLDRLRRYADESADLPHIQAVARQQSHAGMPQGVRMHSQQSSHLRRRGKGRLHVGDRHAIARDRTLSRDFSGDADPGQKPRGNQVIRQSDPPLPRLHPADRVEVDEAPVEADISSLGVRLLSKAEGRFFPSSMIEPDQIEQRQI